MNIELGQKWRFCDKSDVGYVGYELDNAGCAFGLFIDTSFIGLGLGWLCAWILAESTDGLKSDTGLIF